MSRKAGDANPSPLCPLLHSSSYCGTLHRDTCEVAALRGAKKASKGCICIKSGIKYEFEMHRYKINFRALIFLVIYTHFLLRGNKSCFNKGLFCSPPSPLSSNRSISFALFFSRSHNRNF